MWKIELKINRKSFVCPMIYVLRIINKKDKQKPFNVNY